jgi:hypothetical protein
MTMRRAIPASAMAVLLLAAGCGGGDDLSADEEAVRDTYLAYIDAVKAGDGEKACALRTPASQRKAGAAIAVGPRADLRDASCPEVIEQGSLPQLEQVEAELEDIEIDGDRAKGFDPGETVEAGGQPVTIGPQEVYFKRIGGEWKFSKAVFFRIDENG